MVSIILTILKIIGISILVLIGVFILLIILVLFVPIRYKSQGSHTDSDTDVMGRISWMMGIAVLTLRYQRERQLRVRLRICGIPVFDNKRKRRKKLKHKENELNNKSELRAASSASSLKENIICNEENEENEPKELKEPDAITLETMEKESAQAFDDGENGKKMTIYQKIKCILSSFFTIFRNIKFTFQKICVTIVKIKDNIKYYLELLQQENTKRVFTVCKKQFLKLFKNLCPKKYKVNLHLGFEEPDLLGNVLAVFAVLYPYHRGRIDIQPEFGKNVFECSYQLKGKISIYVFLWTVWIFFTDRNIRQLRKTIKIDK